ncbi:MAG: hypothetical protein AAGL96_09100, partial [Pseudomonadota bacterium]
MSQDLAKPCCTPSRDGAQSVPDTPVKRSTSYAPETVDIPGTRKPILGTAHPKIPIDGEAMRRASPLRPFRMATTCVTNADFAT